MSNRKVVAAIVAVALVAGTVAVIACWLEADHMRMVAETGQGSNGPFGAYFLGIVGNGAVGVIAGLQVGTATRVPNMIGQALLIIIVAGVAAAVLATGVGMLVPPMSQYAEVPAGLHVVPYAVTCLPTTLLVTGIRTLAVARREHR